MFDSLQFPYHPVKTVIVHHINFIGMPVWDLTALCDVQNTLKPIKFVVCRDI